MKLEQIFYEFILVVKDYRNYVIGLLDDSGRIKFSSEKNLIGNIIPLHSADKRNLFFKVHVKKQNFGYLWVYSEDSEIEIVGRLLAQSLATRIEYELADEFLQMNASLDEQLIKLLLDEEKMDLQATKELMQEMKIDWTLPRVAVLICSNRGFEAEEVKRLKYRTEHKGTILALLDSKRLLLFKTLPQSIKMGMVKEVITSFIEELKDWGLAECRYYVGSVQNKLSYYKQSYEACLWLTHQKRIAVNQTVFFEDYQVDFFVSFLIESKVNQTFNYYYETISTSEIDEMVMIADGLFQADYNVTQAAEKLFVHKNTLVYKLKKYEEQFGLDIRGTFQGKVLFYMLSKLFKNDQKQEQAGGQL